MKLFPALCLITAALLASTSCNKDEREKANYGVKGSVQKGPFIEGSSISIQTLDESFNPTGKYYSTLTTNEKGNYSIESAIDSKYIEIIAEGYYFNEIEGAISKSPISLRAIADLSEGVVTNVNTLTTLEYYRVKSLLKRNPEMPFKKARQQADDEILSSFGIPRQDYSSQEDEGFVLMDITKAGDRDAMLLAVSIILQAGRTEGEFSEYYSQLAQQFQNGPVNISLTDYQEHINVNDIRNNCETRFGHVPAFELYLDMDSNGKIDKYSIATEDRNIIDVSHEGGIVSYGVITAIEDYTATVNCDWIHVVSTKAFLHHNLILEVEPNETLKRREAIIAFSIEGGDELFIQVIQHPDKTKTLLVEPDNTSEWSGSIGDFEHVVLKGEFSHEELALMASEINTQHSLIRVFDLSQLVTSDGELGASEQFLLPDLNTLILPINITTLQGGILQKGCGTIENLEWENSNIKRIVWDEFNTRDVPDDVCLFNGAWQPDSLYFPSSVRELAGPLFQGWKSIKSFTFDDAVTIPYSYGMFNNCDNLTYVKLPATFTGFAHADNMFAGCRSLRELVLPAVPNFDFANCSFINRGISPKIDLRGVGDIVLNTGSVLPRTHYVCNYKTPVLSTICSDIELYSSGYVFDVYVSGIKISGKDDILPEDPNWMIGKTFNYIFGPDVELLAYDAAFAATSVVFENPNTKFEDDRYADDLPLFPYASAITLPANIEDIPAYSFQGCGNHTTTFLKEVKNTSNIKRIGERAFLNTTIETMDVPALTTIGAHAFASCVSLKDINFPSLTVLGEGAFSTCYSLSSITIPEGVTSIPVNCFYNCTSLADIHLPSTITSIGRSAFANCAFTSLSFLPLNLANYPFDALGGFTAEEVDVPEGPTSVSKVPSSFRVRKIVLPSSLLTIPAHFLNNNDIVKEVVVKEGTTSVDGFAFAYCSKLKTIELPSTTVRLSNKSFSQLQAMESLYLKAAKVPESFPTAFDVDSMNSDFKIYVPRSAYDDYLSADTNGSLTSHIVAYDY